MKKTIKILSVMFLASLVVVSCKKDEPDEPASVVASFQYEVSDANWAEVMFTNYSQNATTYAWDFGDGNFSNQDFPTHFYNQAGVYNVCLTLTEANGCTSTYCDSLGMDQNGYLIYNGQSTGFKLVVIDPATIGQEENRNNQMAIYPKPT